MPPRGQQHSPELWAQILALWDLGLTIYKIATQLDIPPSTVQVWLLMQTQILKEELCGTMADLSIPVCCTVSQHDNDPKHTAKVTQEWLNTQQLSVLPWPANSPYMNIIENVWDYLDHCGRMRHQLPMHANDLWAILQEEWECIPQAYIDKLYDSMTERVQEVIDRKGGNTCY
ncbi:Transposable element Tcb2 transposase [Rhizoctonia solani]|uniref:Transposable element Tcb2 transposase n=1 Tax=Rhizoctonia solani TaxID=456999 RepID=A0A8H8NP16_9AGAM|nr:Transposable element Tcb2 transposase [Rhizoctonia solani]QRW15707.1 Transposable element Tcb2 transposase [Rhizoctonia solani]